MKTHREGGPGARGGGSTSSPGAASPSPPRCGRWTVTFSALTGQPQPHCPLLAVELADSLNGVEIASSHL